MRLNLNGATKQIKITGTLNLMLDQLLTLMGDET